MAEQWLLADFGGTNTRVGLASPEQVSLHAIDSFLNAAFENPEDLLRAYLEKRSPGSVTALCAGAAGPVRQRKAQLTNHDWCIDADALATKTGAAHVTLLNDLQAQGYALDDLSPDQITPLFPGSPPAQNATRLVMGLGTGSNAAVVHSTKQGLFVPPSEAGHMSLPYVDGKLAELVAHLGEGQSHRPMESALSGPGISTLHAWLTKQSLLPTTILERFRGGDDAATETLHLFGTLLGHVTSNLALSHLPMGGVYFIGGLARAVAPLLGQTGFHAAFCDKGPYTPLLQDIPISLITNDHAALLGCARHLRQRQSGSYSANLTPSV